MSGKSGDAEQGFTLVEMLAVLSIVGLMSGLMLAMMGQFRGLIASERSLGERAALQRTVYYIADIVEQAETLPLNMESAGPAQFLESTGSSLRFLAVAGHGSYKSDLSEYTISIEPDANSRNLVEVQTSRRKNAGEADMLRTILLEDAQSLELSFLDLSLPEADLTSWKNEWLNNSALPAAVRVALTKTDKRGNLMTATAIAYIGR